MTTVLQARPHQFVNTPITEQIARRSLRYLQSGYSVHLKGPAGTGKTTLAMHLADIMGRPIMMLFGDDEFKTSDLIGNQTGYTRKKVVDNYIHSVVKVEDELSHNWVDSRLTMACREGFTLVYDEFNRSRPEVNNVLLSALEEKILILPPSGNRQEYVRVHPNFRVIFTSNPEEYCGVHATQDALLDRLITIHMPEPDELTQQQILVQKVGIEPTSALFIVRFARQYLEQSASDSLSSLRPCMMIASICHQHDMVVSIDNPDFRDVCRDILLSRADQLAEANEVLWTLFNQFDSKTIESLPNPVEEAPTQPQASIPETVNPVKETPAQLQTSIPDTVNTKQVNAAELAVDTETILADLEVDVAESSTTQPAPLAQQEMTPSVDPTDTTDPLELLSTATTQIEKIDLESAEESLTPSEASISSNPSEFHPDSVDDSHLSTVHLSTAAPPTDISVSALGENESIKSTIQPQSDGYSRKESKVIEVVDPIVAITPEEAIYQHLKAVPKARLSQIEKAVGLKRVQVVNALRALIKAGRVAKKDRPGQPSVYQANLMEASLVS